MVSELSPEAMDLASDWDLRRVALARRMLLHRARTQTVCRLTGFKPARLTTLRHRWGIATDDRHRGPSPNSIAQFFRNATYRTECSAVLSLWRIFGGVAARPHTPRSQRTHDVSQGERLCEVFEAFRRIAGDGCIDFELLVLLIDCFARSGTVRMAACSGCSCAIIIDHLDTAPELCSICCYHEHGTTRRPLPQTLLRQQTQQYVIQHEQDH
jgi:hypothetical protein